MLDRMVGTYGMLFIFFIFFFGACACMGMVGQWYTVQDQAQFVAMSEGRYGGYTTDAETSMDQFCQDDHLNRSDVAVQVSAPGAPVPWGTPVTAEVTVPYQFQVGSLLSFTVPITGVGRSVSSYMPDTYDVSYTTPAA